MDSDTCMGMGLHGREAGCMIFILNPNPISLSF